MTRFAGYYRERSGRGRIGQARQFTEFKRYSKVLARKTLGEVFVEIAGAGGIAGFGTKTHESLVIRNSTITNNTAGGSGGDEGTLERPEWQDSGRDALQCDPARDRNQGQGIKIQEDRAWYHFRCCLRKYGDEVSHPLRIFFNSCPCN
jgi:hypothetical protein